MVKVSSSVVVAMVEETVVMTPSKIQSAVELGQGCVPSSQWGLSLEHGLDTCGVGGISESDDVRFWDAVVSGDIVAAVEFIVETDFVVLLLEASSPLTTEAGKLVVGTEDASITSTSLSVRFMAS